MKLFLIFLQSVLPIFLIILVAFIYNRFKHIELKSLTDVTLTIFAPLFVFYSLTTHKISIDLLYRPFVFMVFLVIALIVIAIVVFKLLRIDEQYKIPFILSVSMINVGNFGLPLISFVFGEKGVFYSIIFFIVFNIPLSTLAIMLSSNEKNFFYAIKDVLKIPLIHAFLVAIGFSLFNIQLPDFLNKTIGLLSMAAIPLLIFILGLQLSNIKISSRFLRPALVASFLRLVISPIIALFIVYLLGLKGVEKNVAVVQTSAPSALLPLMYAIKFNRSPEFLSTVIFLSTLLSGFTLTILINYLR
ncbi:AEC family transporter [Deferribacter autotrophicus]|uniref:AEC family transporter n=1 Tax=Deferribacter autotrophicus TaxID=500465 RepID=A0A5A8F6R5_9BACT|nr:AEC family transporter [Deferribacter autotrophicus]KAA0257675.1 AEC family transporter [Deferribacter autotrophicus]